MKSAGFLTLATLISLSAVPVHANPVRVEAEDMTLDTYRVENVATASNGRVINLKVRE